MRGKLTWLNLWNLLTINFSPSINLIISPHAIHPPINLPKKVCSPMQSFFTKKSFPILCRREKRQYALLSYLFPFLKVSYITFAAQIMTFQAKLTSHCFYSHTVWFWNFPNCFKPKLQNHIAKNIKLGDKFVTNL